MKKLTEELRAEFTAAFDRPEVKELLQAIEKAADKDSGTFEVVISTENLDRYQEVIKLDGWELDHYRNNPVVLWGHDHKLLPIGAATSVEIRDGKLTAKGKFASHPHAQEIRKLYDAGIVNATSVGFIAKEYEGNLITKSELLEFSFVSVPANPYALRLAMEREFSVNELVTKGIFTIPEELQKGAVQEQQDAVEARRSKWEKFAQVDDLICAFWGVYFDEGTAVDEFNKLCTETADLLKMIGTGEKASAFAGKAIADSGMKEVRERLSTLKSLSKAQVGAVISALEVLAKSEEPEGAKEGEQEEEVPEQKQFEEFSEMRKFCQEFVTGLSGALAEARRINDAHR